MKSYTLRPDTFTLNVNLLFQVRFLMLIEFPIAWPLGKLLDCIFGKDHRTSTTRERGGRGGGSPYVV